MSVIGINGSPRKTWNTAELLKNAMEGAAAQGAETELVHLYDLDYKGCRSCFACKIKDGPSNGRCAFKDGLTPLLEKIENEADAIILGSPVYFGAMTGEMRSFLERLLFAPLVYTAAPTSLFPRRIKAGVVYTMNVSPENNPEMFSRYQAMFDATAASLANILGEAETFCCCDTYQFPDYSKVVMERMDPEKKASRRRDVFPEDCRRAHEFGSRLARRA